MAKQYSNLRLPYGVKPHVLRDSVILEQEPWDPYIGFLTKMGLVGYLNKLLFDEPDVQENCAENTGAFGKEIYAYPSRQNLNYVADCSWGTLGDRRITTIDYTEAVQCNLELKLSLKYPAISVTRYVWAGEAYSPEGESLARPVVTVVGAILKLSKKVYGTILVTYKVCRHTYNLRVPARGGAIENKYQSFVYAVWEGGNTYLEVERPEGLEEGKCNNFGSGGDHFTGGEPQVPESVPPSDEYKDIDYCTGVEL